MRLRRSVFLLVAIGILAAGGWLAREPTQDAQSSPSVATSPAEAKPSRPASGTQLPAEALQTLQLIEAGGPFPYDRDGTVFQNREGRLPAQPRGYYREYTVRTPGSRDRGARRLVSGGDPPRELFYTDDHYRTFRRIEAFSR